MNDTVRFNVREFILAVTGSQDGLCLAVSKHKKWFKHYFPESFDAAQNLIADAQRNRNEVYFCTASLQSPERKLVNASHIKSLWLDLDCGEGTPYPTYKEGLVGVKALCEGAGLPKPTVVTSGYGLHVYWIMDKAVPTAIWSKLQQALLIAADTHGLFVKDKSIHSDWVRVLRVPGTKNFKNDPARDVVQLTPTVVREVGAISKALVAYRASVTEKPKAAPTALAAIASQVRNEIGAVKMDSATALLDGGKKYSFEKIIRLSVEDREQGRTGTEHQKGCPSLLYMLENRATLTEPVWRAGLSIAQHSVDRNTAIHILSEGHADYDPQATEDKASKCAGPYYCETIMRDLQNVCGSCQFKSSKELRTPLKLGLDMKFNDEDIEVVVAKNERIERNEDLGIEGSESMLRSVKVVIPSPPEGYHRGPHGGVYREVVRKDGSTDVATVCDKHFYMVGRVRPDSGGAEEVLFNYHTAEEGVVEVTFPAGLVHSDTWVAHMQNNRVMIDNKAHGEAMRQYVLACMKKHKDETSAVISYSRFGWTPHYKSFVVGDREIMVDRVIQARYTGPASAIGPALHEKGDIEVWKDVVNYYNTPDRIGRAFAVCVGAFASPILSLVGPQNFPWFHIFTADSSKGKSSILRCASAVWGHPQETWAEGKDTANYRVLHRTACGDIGQLVDELTNMDAAQLSNEAYSGASGAGKGKVNAKSNTAMQNKGSWRNIRLSNGNRDLITTLQGGDKSSPHGEAARIFPLPIEADTGMTTYDAERWFNRLHTNYGHACVPFIQFILKNKDAVIAKHHKYYERLASYCNGSSMRIALHGLAAALAGSDVARTLGLIDYDNDALFNYAKTQVQEYEGVVSDMTKGSAPKALIGMYLNKRVSNRLVIKSDADFAGMEDAERIVHLQNGIGLKEIPKGPLYVREEFDNGCIYIDMADLKKFLSEKQSSISTLLKVTKLETVEYNLQRGWSSGAEDLRKTECLLIRRPVTHAARTG